MLNLDSVTGTSIKEAMIGWMSRRNEDSYKADKILN
jgi:hypothetical protein